MRRSMFVIRRRAESGETRPENALVAPRRRTLLRGRHPNAANGFPIISFARDRDAEGLLLWPIAATRNLCDGAADISRVDRHLRRIELRDRVGHGHRTRAGSLVTAPPEFAAAHRSERVTPCDFLDHFLERRGA